MKEKCDVELIEDYRRTHMLPVKKKRRITPKELKIRDIILDLQATCTNIQIAERAAKVLGTPVSYSRVQRIKKDMEEESREQFRSLTSFEAALESRHEYQRLINEGHKLLIEAELIDDPVNRVNTKRQAINTIREAREAEDRMYKMIGLHKEQMLIGHVNVMELEEWKDMVQAFLVYLNTVLECPQCGFKGFDPTEFFDFMDHVSRDPHYVDQFVSRTAQDNYAHRHYGKEARELMEEAEFEESG